MPGGAGCCYCSPIANGSSHGTWHRYQIALDIKLFEAVTCSARRKKATGTDSSPAFLQDAGDVPAGSTPQSPALPSACVTARSISLALCLIQRRADVYQSFFVQTY